MADNASQDRILPSLLERLTDEEPERKQDTREQRVLSMRRYKESVLRDLAWLLNTTNAGMGNEMRAHPEAARSVLNFGIPDLAGTTSSTVNPHTLAKAIREAILVFEPRILAHTLDVQLSVDDDSRLHNRLEMIITGDLWASPVPVHVLVNTAVDLETGAFGVSEQG
ncbi:MAG: type VI secretion system baseplate subunit TssE [Gammaproteobacteria bacterium]|nr:type VI secretion system baseplate subunit TssE [Gammaproteobacteria bacterium]